MTSTLIGATIKPMKKLFVFFLALMLFGCAPVLNRELMRQGELNPSFDQLRTNTAAYEGRLYIVGGVIVETRLVEDGTQIEVLGFPVDSRGYLEEGERAKGRFLALFPREKGLLDPLIYKKGRLVTLAAVFQGTRAGKIDELEYVFPVFGIRQVHLWDEEEFVYYPYRYPYWYYPYAGPYWYGPYWRPGPWLPPPGWW